MTYAQRTPGSENSLGFRSELIVFLGPRLLISVIIRLGRFIRELETRSASGLPLQVFTKLNLLVRGEGTRVQGQEGAWERLVMQGLGASGNTHVLYVWPAPLRKLHHSQCGAFTGKGESSRVGWERG